MRRRSALARSVPVSNLGKEKRKSEQACQAWILYNRLRHSKQGYRLTRLRTNTLIINSIAIVYNALSWSCLASSSLKSGVGQGYGTQSIESRHMVTNMNWQVFNTALFLLRLCTPFPVYFSKVRFAEIIIHGNGGIDASVYAPSPSGIRPASWTKHRRNQDCASF